MHTEDHMAGVEFDQDTAPKYLPGDPAAVQAAASEKEIEFDIGDNLDMGTATEDFDPELVKQMEPESSSKEETQEEEPEDVVEILEPKSDPKRWLIGPEGAQMELYQRPMSFIQKMQWFALVGEMFDKAMAGDNPLSLADLMDSPTAQQMQAGEAVQMRNLREADTFVRAVGKIVRYAPDFLIDSYVIWLGVSSNDRRLVREILQLPEEEGGLSDEMGMEMIEIFIDQNWDALERFFSERIGAVQKRIASRQEIRRRKA